MRFRHIAAALLLGLTLTLAACGGDDEDCQLVCDKSAECGSTTEGCMESCQNDKPSDACIACYEEDSCADVGRCLSSCGG